MRTKIFDRNRKHPEIRLFIIEIVVREDLFLEVVQVPLKNSNCDPICYTNRRFQTIVKQRKYIFMNFLNCEIFFTPHDS